MGRKKNGNPAGRSNSFKGTKLSFLESYKDEFLESYRSDAGPFYSKIARLFILKYGFDLPINDDAPGDEPPEDNPSNVITAPGLSETEVARRSQVYKDLRMVRRSSYSWFRTVYLPNVSLQKLGQWYRHRYAAKKSDKSVVSEFLESLSQIAPCPRRRNPIHLYSLLYYKDKMQSDFQEIWKNAQATVPGTERLNVYRLFITERWNSEPQSLRDEITARANKEYEDAVELYKGSKKKGNIPQTPEAYAR